jgi:hypothetical protein
MGWVGPEGHCRHPRMGLTVEVPDLADVGADRFNGAKRKPSVMIGSPLGFAVFDAAEVFPGDAMLNEEGFTREPFR